MNRILLDTNAYSEFLRGNDQVLSALAKSKTVFVSIFVLGELFCGFKGGKKESQNKDLLSRFLDKSTVQVLDATQETAEIFGFVKNDLRIKGTPIPINDIWIAAHTIESGSTIVTFDDHFNKIAGLRIWSP